MQFGWVEVLLFVAAIILLFGMTRLARSIGRWQRAFKDGIRESERNTAGSFSQIKAGTTESGLSSLSDEEILAEMQRRTVSRP
jgi:Sec-independent protein translocase protein TatA